MVEELNKHSKAPLMGVILLFGAVLLAGVAIGGLVSLIGNFIYLILIFPVFMGLAAGAVVKSVVVSQKIRSPFVVIAAGIFSALVIYGSMHFVDYLQFRNSLAKEIQSQVVAEYGEPAPREDVQAYIDYIFVEETGTPGFVGFILLEAREGVSISHVGVPSSGSDMNLGMFTWVYWLIEMGIIGWGSIDAAHKASRDLFCEHCDAWVAQGVHIGGMQIASTNQAIEFINRRDFVGLAGILRNDTVLPSVEFYTRTCKTCSTFPFYLTGTLISAGKKGQTQSKLFTVQVLNSSERFALATELASPNSTR